MISKESIFLVVFDRGPHCRVFLLENGFGLRKEEIVLQLIKKIFFAE